MNKIKVGINGFGRIGRMVFRNSMNHPEIEIVGINDLCSADYLAYLLKYDTMHGKFDGEVSYEGNNLVVNGKKYPCFCEKNAADLPWGEVGAEYIIESTGAYNSTEKASAHLLNGAKKVVLSAPSKDSVTPTFVMGVNHRTYSPEMDVVSNASCTTNCLAPMTKVINDTFGIRQALMSTIHSATAKQKAVDSRAGRDWRTGRSILGNIIPSSTGAAKAVGEVIPELKGRMTGMSFRVPTNDVSVVDLTARLKQPATYEDICIAMRNAAKNSMRGIITCTTDQLVSSDLTGFPETCIFDETAGIMLDNNFVKLIAWYDNEWGYANKLLDLIAHMYEQDNGGIDFHCVRSC